MNKTSSPKGEGGEAGRAGAPAAAKAAAKGKDAGGGKSAGKPGLQEGGAIAPSPEMARNLARIEELSRRLIAALSRRRPHSPALDGPSPELYAKAGAALMAEWMTNPARLIGQQVEWWGRAVQNYMEAQQAMLAAGAQEEGGEEAAAAARRDRRFSHPLWYSNPYFSLLRKQYLLNAETLEKSIDALEGLPPPERERLRFFTRQIIDMMAPTNFLATNPDALERAVETGGESLVRGLENLVRDLEANDGDLLVTLADPEAFRVGENIAGTEGAVIYRNRLFELIQYAPRTESVHEIPVLLFPPWINKFYILDLRPDNSLIRWIVDQGYTLFVVSWINPDESYADVGLEDYIREGYLEALRVVKDVCATDEVNAVGYCIAGTMLALTLALLEKRGERSVRAATFFTTLTDFSEPGEFAVFLEDDFVDAIEEEAKREGVLRSYFMARTFSYLRPNDLVYQPAIRSYMLGEPPPAFDLLYWNGDGTNLPARMTVEYLRLLCRQNRFAEGGIEILGETLHIRDVKRPLTAIACETDHIAPWKASFRGVAKMGARSKRFILSQSGHIAGIVNPPSRDKYGHYTSKAEIRDPEAWYQAADFHPGSWWPRWERWLRRHAGRKVAARIPGASGCPVLAPAPGTYVLNAKYEAPGEGDEPARK